jgi:CubicO group peptidase (beta-lactamase class C family)
MRLANLTHLLTEALRAGAAPGAAMALSIDGERMETAVGVANSSSGVVLSSSSRFQLGCITKLLTSLITLELASVGRIDLDEPIGTYLPQIGDGVVGRSTTLRHLLSHTSGYQGVNVADPAIRYYYSWPKFLDALRSGTQLFPSGRVFNYEHTEYVMLGEIVRRVTGQPIHELFRTMIFDPLEIQCGSPRTDAESPHLCVMDHAFDAASGHYAPLRLVHYCHFWEASLSDLTMSLTDLVTLGEAAAGLTSRQIFNPSTVETMRRPYVDLPACIGGPQHERIPVAFGCGCAQYGDFVFGHNGSARGQTCALRFDLSSRVVLAVGLNCWRPHVRDMLCAKVFAAISDGGPGRRKSDGLRWSCTELAGRYVGALGTWVDVSAGQTCLWLDIRGGSASQPLAQVSLCPGREGELEVISDAPHLTVGFFSPSPSERPALMLGLNAFRKLTPGDHG